MPSLRRAVRLNQGNDAGAIVAELLTAYPLAARRQSGMLPLHFAAKFQKGANAAAIVVALLRENNKAARQKDEDGWLPLHYAAQYQAGSGEHAIAVVTALLTAWHTHKAQSR